MTKKIYDLPKEKIDEIFENAKSQYDYLEELYNYIIPNFEQVVEIYPRAVLINDTTSTYIYIKAIEFDKAHHPDILAGGLWMNQGFATSAECKLEDWKVEVDFEDVYYEEEIDYDPELCMPPDMDPDDFPHSEEEGE